MFYVPYFVILLLLVHLIFQCRNRFYFLLIRAYSDPKNCLTARITGGDFSMKCTRLLESKPIFSLAHFCLVPVR